MIGSLGAGEREREGKMGEEGREANSKAKSEATTLTAVKLNHVYVYFSLVASFHPAAYP